MARAPERQALGAPPALPQMLAVPHAEAPLSAIAALVRRADPDRFLTALFAPPERREALLTLYAFNNELARAREATSQPALAMIRLQWWREVIEGARRTHEVATPLGAMLDDGSVDPGEALALIDAREAELDTIESLADWRAYLLASAGSLAMAAGRILGAPGEPRLRLVGAAYGAAGVLRSVPALARAGRCLLPAETLAAHGLTPEDVIAKPDAPTMQAVRATLAAEGRGWLREAAGPRIPAPWRAAALVGVLARRDLGWPGIAAPRGLGDRSAVTWAAVIGRITASR